VRPGQPLKVLQDFYDKFTILRELEWIHKRVNEIFTVGEIVLDRTLTPEGTVGAQTINKIAGTVRMAAAESSVVVTNSFVNENSGVFVVIRTNDATGIFKNAVPADGSFTIRTTAAVTAETEFYWWVVN